MDPVHRLNESEIADALQKKPVRGSLAACASCAAEYAQWAELGARLRSDLRSRADMPEYFWQRQQARIREQLVPRTAPLGWAAAAIVALVLAASGMLQITPTTQTRPTVQAQQADADELLLRDVQASLQREVPAPLMPVAVLVQEVAKGSQQDQQVKEN